VGAGNREIVAVAVFAGSAVRIAVKVTVCGAAMDDGAVYNPPVVTVPAPDGVTVQEAAWLPPVSTAAVNCCVSRGYRVTLAGVTCVTPPPNTVTIADALFEESATLTALTVTVCCDATAGAVYRPPDVIVPAPEGLTDHVTAVLFVSITVARNCCVCSAARETAAGATVTATGPSVTAADADLLGSATLVAFTRTVCGLKLDGAVYRPVAETEPTAGVTDQVTAVFDVFITVAVNCCVCSAPSETAAGATVTPTVATSVTAAVADLVISATLVAFTLTVWAVRLAGAVYSPVAETEPTAGVTDQVTAVFEVFTTVAVNCCDCDGSTVALRGLTLTETPFAAKLIFPAKAL